MKTRASVKRRGDKNKKNDKGFFVKRKGVLFYINKENPRENQRQG
jgi:ribosomal protein L36